eukprot:3350922-Pleurochrysis_carterae.AAC.1
MEPPGCAGARVDERASSERTGGGRAGARAAVSQRALVSSATATETKTESMCSHSTQYGSNALPCFALDSVRMRSTEFLVSSESVPPEFSAISSFLEPRTVRTGMRRTEAGDGMGTAVRYLACARARRTHARTVAHDRTPIRVSQAFDPKRASFDAFERCPLGADGKTAGGCAVLTGISLSLCAIAASRISAHFTSPAEPRRRALALVSASASLAMRFAVSADGQPTTCTAAAARAAATCTQ